MDFRTATLDKNRRVRLDSFSDELCPVICIVTSEPNFLIWISWERVQSSVGRSCSHGCQCIQCLPFGFIPNVAVMFKHFAGNVPSDAEDCLFACFRRFSQLGDCRMPHIVEPKPLQFALKFTDVGFAAFLPAFHTRVAIQIVSSRFQST